MNHKMKWTSILLAILSTSALLGCIKKLGNSSNVSTTVNPNYASSQAYLVGSGIASLSAAVFMIRDGNFPAGNIHILEQLPVIGGSMDGSTIANGVYVSRGGRMLESKIYVCLWNLLKTIPTLTDPNKNVYDETMEFNQAFPTDSKARLIDKNHNILDATDLGLSAQDRAALMQLISQPESALEGKRIQDVFSDHFFQSNFWYMWRTTFAFQNWHSVIELRRYFMRFVQDFPSINNLGGVVRTKMNQYDSIIAPTIAWLQQRGVDFQNGIRVTDVDFNVDAAGNRTVTKIYYQNQKSNQPGIYTVNANDFAFITIGSLTADSTYGGDNSPAPLITDKEDGSWRLWETLAKKFPDFGQPAVFSNNVQESKWESFTMTLSNSTLINRIQSYSGNAPGTGALMTFKDSSWLMSIVVPHAPHFNGQPDGVYTIWGYALLGDNNGDYIGKPMAAATGQEILTEVIGQLGFSDIAQDVRANTTVIPVMLPYIDSEFELRKVTDRPLVIPSGAKNFALLGQYVEIPGDTVFTVEYSVRAAMIGVYGLLGLNNPIPAIYNGLTDPTLNLEMLKM